MRQAHMLGVTLVLGAIASTVSGEGFVDDIARVLRDAGEAGSGEASGEAVLPVQSNASQLNVTLDCPSGNVTKPRICEPGGEDNGVFFPLFGNSTTFGPENSWPLEIRAVLYFIGMIYAFAGVSLYADTFMCAIEAITSSSRTITDKDTKSQTIVKVWNPTIANLSLMALGSSAPEILLSVIEVLNNRFYSGALGPSTIVGSAAFNLLVIIAICTISVTEYKRIDRHKVFIVTAIGSIFAYVWLALMLLVITPNVVDWWEALLTMLAFPILVIVAWRADVARAKELAAANESAEDYIVEMKDMSSGEAVASHGADKYTGNKLEAMMNTMIMARNAAETRGDGAEIFDAEGTATATTTIVTQAEKEEMMHQLKSQSAMQGGQSMAVYRALGTRAMFGKKTKVVADPTLAAGAPTLEDAIFQADDPEDLPPAPPLNGESASTGNGYITFARAEVNVYEGGSKTKDVPRSATGNCYAHLAVHRVHAGQRAEAMTVKYTTVSGSAVEGKDFVGVDAELETLTFGQ